MKVLEQIVNVIVQIIKWILILGMIFFSALTFYQVIMRYVFNNAPSWSEELIRYSFVWVSLVGGALGIKEGSHFGIDFIMKALPETPRKVVEIIVNLAIVGFGVFLYIYGSKMVHITAKQFSPAMRLPMKYVYLALPVTAVLIIFFTLEKIILRCRKKKEGEEPC